MARGRVAGNVVGNGIEWYRGEIRGEGYEGFVVKCGTDLVVPIDYREPDGGPVKRSDKDGQNF